MFIEKSDSWVQIPFLPLKNCSVQSLSSVRLFATPWITACHLSPSITNSRSLLKLMSIEQVMPSNHLILCRSLLLPPSIFPSIRGFSKESVLCIRWPKYWSFSFSISPSKEYSRLISAPPAIPIIATLRACWAGGSREAQEGPAQGSKNT